MNGYGAIYSNYESEFFYTVNFASVTYTLQEYVESDGNELVSGDFVCNAIYIHLTDGINLVYISSYEKEKIVTVSMRTLAIPNIDIKVWTRKHELLQGNYPRYSTQPEITRQKPFGLTDIEYDRTKDQICKYGTC